MESNLNRILVIGSSHSNKVLLRNLEGLAQQNSAHIEYLDSSESNFDKVLDAGNQTASAGSENSHSIDRNQGEMLNFDREKLFAAVLIQDTDNDNDLEEKLPFHENIHRNQILWYSFQEYLLQNEIDSVVFLAMPEGSNELILYQAAKAQNVDVLILYQSPFSNQFFSFRSIQDCGNYDKNAESTADVRYSEENTSTKRTHQHSQSNRQDSKSSDILKIFRFLLKARSSKLLNPAYILRRAKNLQDAPVEFGLWKDPYAKFFYCKSVAYFEFFTSNHTSKIDLKEKFVYFPLQSLADLHTELLISRFGDQLLALERLASMLPKEYKIFVKSDQLRNSDYLTPMFFHRIKRIQNVVRLPSCFGVAQLIDHSEFVATVNSKDGWEALSRNKKVLVFGHPWYRNLPGAHRYHDDFEFSEITEPVFSNSDFQRQLNCLIDQSHSGQLDTTNENQLRVAKTIYDLVFNRINVTFQSLSS